jgi:hypothetical protein
MVHLALQESLEGAQADWLEKVGDAIYGAAPVAV